MSRPHIYGQIIFIKITRGSLQLFRHSKFIDFQVREKKNNVEGLLIYWLLIISNSYHAQCTFVDLIGRDARA